MSSCRRGLRRQLWTDHVPTVLLRRGEMERDYNAKVGPVRVVISRVGTKVGLCFRPRYSTLDATEVSGLLSLRSGCRFPHVSEIPQSMCLLSPTTSRFEYGRRKGKQKTFPFRETRPTHSPILQTLYRGVSRIPPLGPHTSEKTGPN